MNEFKIRPFSKTQLAQLYFPDSTAVAARRRLMRWIMHCKPLVEALAEANYKPRSCWFSPRQVRLIVDFLGCP